MRLQGKESFNVFQDCGYCDPSRYSPSSAHYSHYSHYPAVQTPTHNILKEKYSEQSIKYLSHSTLYIKNVSPPPRCARVTDDSVRVG